MPAALSSEKHTSDAPKNEDRTHLLVQRRPCGVLPPPAADEVLEHRLVRRHRREHGHEVEVVVVAAPIPDLSTHAPPCKDIEERDSHHHARIELEPRDEQPVRDLCGQADGLRDVYHASYSLDPSRATHTYTHARTCIPLQLPREPLQPHHLVPARLCPFFLSSPTQKSSTSVLQSHKHTRLVFRAHRKERQYAHSA